MASPVCFFEVEHSTSVHSGLLRLNDVRIDYPVPKAFIVAAQGRRQPFDKQVGRRLLSPASFPRYVSFLAMMMRRR